MKKILALTAVFALAASTFAGGFKNAINLGISYDKTSVEVDSDTLNSDECSVSGVGANIGWRGTFSNGITLLVDFDIAPNAKLEDDDDDFALATFELGVGKEVVSDNITVAIAGILASNALQKDENDVKMTLSQPIIGANIYAAYSLNKTVGLYVSATAGVTLGGECDIDTPLLDTNYDLKKGKFFIAPKAGIAITF